MNQQTSDWVSKAMWMIVSAVIAALLMFVTGNAKGMPRFAMNRAKLPPVMQVSVTEFNRRVSSRLGSDYFNFYSSVRQA